MLWVKPPWHLITGHPEVFLLNDVDLPTIPILNVLIRATSVLSTRVRLRPPLDVLQQRAATTSFSYCPHKQETKPIVEFNHKVVGESLSDRQIRKKLIRKVFRLLFFFFNHFPNEEIFIFTLNKETSLLPSSHLIRHDHRHHLHSSGALLVSQHKSSF